MLSGLRKVFRFSRATAVGMQFQITYQFLFIIEKQLHFKNDTTKVCTGISDAPENYSIPSVSAEETEPDETPNERTIVDAYDPPKSEFEPGELVSPL